MEVKLLLKHYSTLFSYLGGDETKVMREWLRLKRLSCAMYTTNRLALMGPNKEMSGPLHLRDPTSGTPRTGDTLEPLVHQAIRAPLRPELEQEERPALLQHSPHHRSCGLHRSGHLGLRARLLADEQPEDRASLVDGQRAAAHPDDHLLPR